MLILLVLLFLGVLYYLSNRTNGGYFSTVAYTLLIYIVSIVCGFFLYVFEIKEPVYPISLTAILYFQLAFFLSIWPLLKYREREVICISITNQRLFYYLKRILIIASLFSIVFYLPHVLNAFTGNIRDARMAIAHGGAGFGVYGILNTFAATSALLYAVVLMMFFLSLVSKQRISAESVLLLISSFSYVILILAFIGRDGMVYWIMTFVFYYIFFRRFMKRSLKRRVKRVGLITVLVFVLPFTVITAARFGSESNEFALAILDYIGQSIINFSDNFQIELASTSGGYRSFPLFSNWFGSSDEIQIQSQIRRVETTVLKGGINYWSFGTYIKSFLYDFGKVGTILLILFISVIEWMALRKAKTKKVFDISNLLVYTVVFQIIGQGVFYFRFYTPGYNFYIILMLALGILLKVRHGRIMYISSISP